MMIRIPFADPRPDDQLETPATAVPHYPEPLPSEAAGGNKAWSFLRPAVRRLFPLYAGQDRRPVGSRLPDSLKSEH
jgi:hypothetical protein